MICATELLFRWPFLLPPVLSVFLEDRGRAASWNVAKAGVEGLLARPLFVVTVVVTGTAGGADSLFFSASSALASFSLSLSASCSFSFSFSLSLSFFAVAATTGVGAALLSDFSTSVLTVSVLAGALDSLTDLTSIFGRWEMVGTGTSDVTGVLPFGLDGAAEAGLLLPVSMLLDCIEFCRARDEAGRGTLVGVGDTRLGILGSGSVVSTGDEAAEEDMPEAPFLKNGQSQRATGFCVFS
jgi:hypothetical protein